MTSLISDLRQYKIGPFAIFDIVISYVGVYLLAPILSKLFLIFHLQISKTAWLWLTLPISIIVHIVFNQNTAFTKMILSPNQFYVEKVVLVVTTVIGISLIKVTK